MMRNSSVLLFVTAVLSILLASCSSTGMPSVVVRPAEPYTLPGTNKPGLVDCNSPVHWDGDTMYVFSSHFHPYRSSGPDLYNLSRPSKRTAYDRKLGYKGGRWIEATYKDDNGKLYGWYHREPGNICPNRWATLACIGAVVSQDNGMNWHDMGFIMEVPDGSSNSPRRFIQLLHSQQMDLRGYR